MYCKEEWSKIPSTHNMGIRPVPSTNGSSTTEDSQSQEYRHPQIPMGIFKLETPKAGPVLNPVQSIPLYYDISAIKKGEKTRKHKAP
ncbi:hypothetical protein GDO86_002951 [Hymenochirus boettgeri]|uniref:Uncharacterized protein n=1 Tax=Hymenochirus boettgeri TaxID=247094 RepID=A0A8T2K7H1_9PIPI|nr:hypothetical protein GDO86_002951 [Hymenochirus boettgeri]